MDSEEKTTPAAAIFGAGPERLARENALLREREQVAYDYLRAKIDQLLQIMGTLPLRAEELDDEHLIALDPIGIVGQSFEQVLEHQKNSNRELAQARDEIRAIFDAAGAAVLVVDADQRLKNYNRKCRELFFPEVESVQGCRCRELICKGTVSAENCVFQQVLLQKQPAEHPSFEAGGRIYQVTGRPLFDGEGEVAEVILVYADITGSIKAEAALRESEERYRSLYLNMKEGVALHQMLYDEAGEAVDYLLLDVNPAFESILGIGRAEAIGARGSEIYGAGKAPFLKQYAQVVARNEPLTFEEGIAESESFFRVSAFVPKAGHFATVFEDITERKFNQRQVEKLAYFDALTGLPNRALFMDRLEQSLAQAERNQQQVGVLFLDIDRFKVVNDTLGHAVGDQLLKTLGERLVASVRQTDTVARMGGDEFVIILPGVQNEQRVMLLAQKVLKAIALPIPCGDKELVCTGSLGIALYPLDGEDTDSLLKKADTAMYQAKKHGNTYQFFTADMNAQVLERLLLENDLRRALEKNQFYLLYQPQLDLGTGRLIGMEALLRWRHPELGLIAPDRFIPLAEETGLINSIGRWVLETACRQNRDWQERGYPPLTVTVNLSGRQFKRTSLVPMINGILKKTGLDPHYLELELTESILMDHVAATKATLQQIRQMGVHLSIDDFGTGYSSLSYLKHFPVERLKIDRSFVSDIPGDPDDAAIAEAIISMAHSLKMKVVAEGVETREQLRFLQQRGCDEVQGYYFGRPMDSGEFTTFLGQEEMCLFQGG